MRGIKKDDQQRMHELYKRVRIHAKYMNKKEGMRKHKLMNKKEQTKEENERTKKNEHQRMTEK